MAARLLVSCPPRRPKEWSEAGIDPYLELEMGVLLDSLYDLQSEINDEGAPLPEVNRLTDNEKPKSPDEVDAQCIASGIMLARWFGQEAQRVYSLLSESDEKREQRELVELIQRKGGWITPRELAQSRRGYRPTSAAEEGLNQLHQDGVGHWAITKTATKPRRKSVLAECPSTNSP